MIDMHIFMLYYIIIILLLVFPMIGLVYYAGHESQKQRSHGQNKEN